VLRQLSIRLIIAFAFIFQSSAQAAVSAIETTSRSDSPFSYGGFSLGVINAESYNQGGTGFFTYNYATINYRVGDRQHFSFRIPFTYRSAGFDTFDDQKNKKQELLIDDLIVDFTNSAALLPLDVEVFSRLRYELPTGKYSIEQNTLGSFRVDLIFSKHIIKHFQMEYWPIFRWNMHTQTVYVNPDNGSLSHTKRYELDQRLNFWYVPNSKVALGGFVGTEDNWLNSSKVNSTARQRDGRLAEHFVKVGPAVRYNLNQNFSFLFNVSNLVPVSGFTEQRSGSMSDLGKFKPEHTQFVLLTFMNF
jgi:hypothetical protein